MTEKKPRGAPKGNSNRRTHGGYSRLAALKGHRWDRRTRTYRAIAARERELCKALGPSISPQKRALAHEIAVIETVLLPPLDTHLAATQIVTVRGKTAPAIALRMRLSDRLQTLLISLGLEKVKRQPTPFWQRQVRRRKNQDGEDRSGDGDPASDKQGATPGEPEGKEIVEGRESPVGELQ